jgi:hypothetical protein
MLYSQWKLANDAYYKSYNILHLCDFPHSIDMFIQYLINI